MPAALIEVGFLTDEAEKEMLQDKEYQEKLAKGISEGIIRYLKSLKS
jgi:N-acetylmuramoyl-L-alanine amidase